MTATDSNAAAPEIEPCIPSTDSVIWHGMREALCLSSSQRVVLRTDTRDVAATYQMARQSASNVKAMEWQCVLAQVVGIVARDLPAFAKFLPQQLRDKLAQLYFAPAEALRIHGTQKKSFEPGSRLLAPVSFGLGMDTPADEPISGYAR